MSLRLKRSLTAALLPAAAQERLAQAAFKDAGHGYDTLGLQLDSFGLAMAVASPLYDLYFRVSSSGAHHIPARGAAIVAANHSGMLPFDAVMLAVDLFRNTNPPRVPRLIGDLFIPFMPWLGTAMNRAGLVSGSRGNVRHLLESEELVVVFPEGTPGIGKGFPRRYQLQDWRVGHVELALRHRVPIVPVGIVGAEESWPQLLRIDSFHPFGAPFLPIPATPIPLPTRFHVRYGEPLELHHQLQPGDEDDPEIARAAAAKVKEAVRELLRRGLEQRRGWFS